MITLFAGITAFVFGLCLGSFLNVCIYRLPQSLSVHNPKRSFCPECKTPIRWYDNIPVISYLILRGKCRSCKAAIPVRYPIVELITGFFAVCAVVKFGPTAAALVHFIFIAALIVITFIDIDYQIIPDVISLPGIPIFFLFSFVLPTISPVESILGILSGGGSLYAVAWGYHLITGKEGMGGGDIKLLAMMGALIGWKGILFTIFFSSVIGTVSGIILMTRSKEGMKLAIPFGPFLSIGAITYIFYGTRMIHWYMNLLRP